MKDKQYLPLEIAERINKKNKIKKRRFTYIIEDENDDYWFLKRALPVKGKSIRMIVDKKTKMIEH